MVKIDIKYLNNKSRKGLYFYVKEKGIRGQYYRTDPKNMLQEKQVVEYYMDKYVKGKKRQYSKDLLPLKRAKKEIIKKLRSAKTIKDSLGKGRSETLIKNAQSASSKRIKNASQRLLKGFIQDEETRKRLAMPNQQKKYKEYVTHYVKFYDNEGNELLNGKYFNKTTYDVVKDLQKRKLIGRRNDSLEEGYDGSLLNLLKVDNIRAVKKIQDGTVARYDVKVILRK